MAIGAKGCHLVNFVDELNETCCGRGSIYSVHVFQKIVVRPIIRLQALQAGPSSFLPLFSWPSRRKRCQHGAIHPHCLTYVFLYLYNSNANQTKLKDHIPCALASEQNRTPNKWLS